MLPFSVLFLCAFLVSFLLTKLVRKKLLARAVLDIPNERSMHTAPVPRGGGLAVMITIIGGLALSLFLFQTMLVPPLLLLAGVALLMFISWLDDKRGASVSVRLGLHLLAALVGSFALGENATLFGDFLPFWLDRLIMILGWAWFMNLYNFMDGIDGITGAQSICCAVGAAIMFGLIGLSDPTLFALCALIAGSCFGFLMLNWHPAKIFLGDVGSVPLGFLIGFLMIKLAVEGYLVSGALIPLYYIVDTGITIAKRIIRREKIWQAHRTHYYQGATAGEKTPVPVVIWIIYANIGLIACAAAAPNTPWLAIGLGVGILILLLAKMSHSARKVPRK